MLRQDRKTLKSEHGNEGEPIGKVFIMPSFLKFSHCESTKSRQSVSDSAAAKLHS